MNMSNLTQQDVIEDGKLDYSEKVESEYMREIVYNAGESGADHLAIEMIASMLDWVAERFQDALAAEELDPGLIHRKPYTPCIHGQPSSTP